MAERTSGISTIVFPSRDGRTYDWPIWEAVKHVRNVVADDDEANCYPTSRTAIRQAAVDSRIFIFGMQELPPPKPSGWHSDIWTLIEPEYWQSNALDPLATDEEWQTHDHTWPEPLVVNGYRRRYWSLMVNREEVEHAFSDSTWPRVHQLLELYRGETDSEYREAEGRITSQFALAGRLQSAAHIVELIKAAEAAVLRLIAKVRHLRLESKIYALAEAHAIAAFDVMAADVRKKGMGLNGRTPSPSNGDLADRLACEARERIKGAIAKWGLEDSLRVLPAAIPPDAAHANMRFEAPQTEWIELWEGPLRFRATFDQGKFGPGHSLDDINKNGLGRSKDREIYTVRADPTDGAIVIEWQVGLPGRKLPEVRYYNGGPGRDHYNRLRDDGSLRKRYFAHLPADLRDRAVGAYATAVTIREWMEQEFFNAIHEGQCEIWARVGSKVAPFQRVPADVFRAYSIKSWGYGQPGAAWAELDGAQPLYAIQVAPAKATSVSAPVVEKVGKTSRRRGRTKGSGSLEAADAPLLLEMRELIISGEAFSPDGAAKRVAHKAKGGGTENSRATRLANRYRASEKN